MGAYPKGMPPPDLQTRSCDIEIEFTKQRGYTRYTQHKLKIWITLKNP